MPRRVFIIHGWGADPNCDWFPWLKTELKSRSFEVYVPEMPDTDNPIIEHWVSCLEKSIGRADKNTYFIGHSIGCQTILRYLESLADDYKVGGVIFVAPWLSLKNLENDKEWRIAKPWLETPIDFNRIKNRADKIVAIFSDNDPVVPLEENTAVFERDLGAKIIVEHGKGHLNEEDGITEFPLVLEKLLEISK